MKSPCSFPDQERHLRLRIPPISLISRAPGDVEEQSSLWDDGTGSVSMSPSQAPSSRSVTCRMCFRVPCPAVPHPSMGSRNANI